MDLIYTHHEGSQATKPAELDTDSSKTVVYIRKNIQKKARADEMSGETITLWEYDEAVISRDDDEELVNIITSNLMNINDLLVTQADVLMELSMLELGENPIEA